MKILVVGQGGREHCLGHYLKQNKKVSQIFFTNGNAGTASIGKNISTKNKMEILDFARKEKIDLTIVGSEQYLTEGIVDDFQEHQLAIFGPDKRCARLEGSKVFAKQFMHKYDIPTARFETFQDAQKAIHALQHFQYPLVIKVSGLAQGKGVIISKNTAESVATIKSIMEEKSFGDAGNEIVLEEFLDGFEVSILSYFNKKDIFPMLSAKDHKKIGEGETGLNTGGMGAVAPHPMLSKKQYEWIEKKIIQNTLQGLLKENLLFHGVLFFGIMVTTEGPYLLEYNLRMGDPETQAVLPLLQSDFLKNTEQCMLGDAVEFQWKKESSCCIVTSSYGYPNSSRKGDLISGTHSLDTLCFFAGVESRKDELYTNGGRVLSVVGIGKTIEEAKKKSYQEVEKIKYDGIYYRKDIGSLN